VYPRRGFLQLGLATAMFSKSQDSISCGAITNGATRYVPPQSNPIPRVRLHDFVRSDMWPQFVKANETLKRGNRFQMLGGWHYSCCNSKANPDIHGNYFFLPWHRLVVHLYERAIREEARNWSLCVPYWQWQTDLGVPPEYDKTPALYALDDQNQVVPRSTENPKAIWELRKMLFNTDGLMGEDPFQVFSQRADANAHMWVHIYSGPVMNDVASAARDPLFFPHHANMDRLWFQWKQHHPGPCPSEIAGDRIYFTDLDGSPKYTTIGAIWDESVLGYTYPREKQLQLKTGISSEVADGSSPKKPLEGASEQHATDFLRFDELDLTEFHLEHHEIVCFAIRLKAKGAPLVTRLAYQVNHNHGENLSFIAAVFETRALDPQAKFTITRVNTNLDQEGEPKDVHVKGVQHLIFNPA
jgi:Common central domain of tyrosinase